MTTTSTKDAKTPPAARAEAPGEPSPSLSQQSPGLPDEEGIEVLEDDEAELVVESSRPVVEPPGRVSADDDGPPPSRAEASTVIEPPEPSQPAPQSSATPAESGTNAVALAPAEGSGASPVPPGLSAEAVVAPTAAKPELAVDRRAAHFAARLERARELLRACEAELAASPEPAREARLHYEAARVLEVPLWDFAAAAEHYEAALRAWPDHTPTLRGLRRVHMALGNYSALPSLLDAEVRGAQSAGRRGWLLYEKGCLYRDYLDDPRQARSAFAAAVELDGSELTWLRALELAEQSERTFAGLAKVYELTASALVGLHRSARPCCRSGLG